MKPGNSSKLMFLSLMVLGIIGLSGLTFSATSDTQTETITAPPQAAQFTAPFAIPKGFPFSFNFVIETQVEITVEGLGTVFSGTFPGVAIDESEMINIPDKQVRKVTGKFSFRATPDNPLLGGDSITAEKVFTWELTPVKEGSQELHVTTEASNLNVTVAGDFDKQSVGELGEKVPITIVSNRAIKAGEKINYTAGYSVDFKKTTTIAPVTVPPELIQVVIGPEPAYTNTAISLQEYKVATGTGTEPFSFIYKWFKNGAQIPGQSSKELPADQFKKGDVITLELTVKDAAGKLSKPVQSNKITVSNLPPNAPTVKLTGGTVLDTVVLSVVGATDGDGDDVQILTQWYYDGVIQPDLENLLVAGPGIKKGTVVKVEAQAFDGEAKTKADPYPISVTIANAKPSIGIIGDQSAKEGRELAVDIPASDPDVDDTLTLSASGIDPAYGTPTIVGKKFTWKPKNIPNEGKKFVVTVTADDGSGGKATREFNIDVQNTNNAPVLKDVPDTNLASPEKYEQGIVANDADGDKLTYQIIASTDDPTVKDAVNKFNTDGKEVASGTEVTLEIPFGDSHAGKLFEFDLFVTDGNGGADRDHFSVAIGNPNRPPKFVNLPKQVDLSKKNDPSVDIYKTKFEATDPDGDTLKITSLGGLPAGAVLESETGDFEWRFVDVKPGIYVVGLQVSDGELKATGSVTFNLVDPNDPPRWISKAPNVTVEEGGSEEIVYQADDPDGQLLSFSAENLPGWVIFSPTTFAYDPKTKQYSQKMVLKPGFDVSNGADAKFELIVNVTDSAGATTSLTASVTVKNKNRPPQFVSDPGKLQLSEDNSLNVPIAAEDPDNDKLTFTLLSGLGTFDPKTLVYTLDLTGNFDIAGSKSDPDNVEIEVSDGNGGKDTLKFQIDIVDVNRPPVVDVQDTVTVPEKPAGEYSDIEVKASDPDGDKFTDPADFSYVALPELPFDAKFVAGSIIFRVSPTFGDAGNYDVTIIVKDAGGLEGKKTFRLNVTKTNRAPVPSITNFTIGENQTLKEDLRTMVNDPDGDDVLFAFADGYAPPEGMMLAPSGLLSWTPNQDQGQPTPYTVNIVVTDKPAAGDPISVPASFTIKVNDVNREPFLYVGQLEALKDALSSGGVPQALALASASQFSDQTAEPGQEVKISDIYALDLDADDLTAKIEGGPGSIERTEHSVILGLIHYARFEYTWTPQAEDSGKQFPTAITVNDGRGGISGKSFTTTVGGKPPILAEVPDQKIKEGESITLVFRLDPNRDQPTNPSLSYTHQVKIIEGNQLPEINTRTFEDNGYLAYEINLTTAFDKSPNPQIYELKVDVLDGNTQFTDDEISVIFVEPVNRKPVLGDLTITPASPLGSQDLVLSFDPPTDPDEDTLTTLIWWFRDEDIIDELDGQKVVPASKTLPGEKWTARVTVFDAFGDIVEKEASVTIGNTAPKLTASHSPTSDITVATPVSFRAQYEDPDGTLPVEILTLEITNTGTGETLSTEMGVENPESLVGTYSYEETFPRGNYTYEIRSDDGTHRASVRGSFTVLDTPHEIKVVQYDGWTSGDTPLEVGVYDADGDKITLTILLGGNPITLEGSPNPVEVETGEYSFNWKSETDLPNAYGNYMLEFRAVVGSTTVKKTMNIQVRNRAFSLPIFRMPDRLVPKVVDVKGIKNPSYGIQLYANNMHVATQAADGKEDFLFEGVKLRDGMNTVQARSWLRYTYRRTYWYPKWERVRRWIYTYRWVVTEWRRYCYPRYRVVVKQEKTYKTVTKGGQTYQVFTGYRYTYERVKIGEYCYNRPVKWERRPVGWRVVWSYRIVGWYPRTYTWTRTLYGAWAKIDLLVDSDLPEVSIVSPERITSDRTPEILAYVNDKNLKYDTIKVTIDGSAPKAASYNPETKMASLIIPETHPLGQGTHKLVVSAQDLAGNIGKEEKEFTINVTVADKTEPAVVKYGPQGTVKGTRVFATFADSQSPLDPQTAELELDGQKVSATYTPIDKRSGTVSFETEIKDPGVHKAIASIADVKGNTASFDWEFEVDNVGPAKPTVEVVSFTAEKSVTVTGNTEPGAKAKLILNGSEVAESAVDTKTGAFSFLDVGLKVGENTVQVLPVDGLGNVGQISDIKTVVRDNLKPQITMLAPKTGQTITALNPLITISITDNSGVDAIELSINDVAITSFDYNKNTGLLSYQAADLEDNQLYEVLVKAVDKVGNERKTTSTFFTRTAADDRVAPSIDNVALGGETVLPGHTLRTRGGAMLLSALVSDTDSGIDTITITHNGTTVGIPDGIYDEATKTVTYNMNLTSSTSVSIDAKDKNGNASSFVFSVDVVTDAPKIKLLSPTDGSRTSSSVTRVTAEIDQVGSNAVVLVNGVPVYSEVVTSSHKIIRDVPINVGSNTVEVRATNDVGLVGSESVTVIRDVDAPTITMTDPLNGETVGNAVKAVLTVEDPSGVADVDVKINGRSASTTSTLGTAVQVIVEEVSAEGLYELLVTATDNLGNTSPQAYKGFFRIDLTGPTVEVKTPGAGEIVTTAFPQLSGAVTGGDINVDSIVVTLGKVGETPETMIHSYNASNGQVLVIPPELSDGDYTLTITAEDLVGNSSSDSRTFTIDTTVPDTVDPVVSNFYPLPGSVISSTALTLLSFIAGDTSSGLDPDLMFLTINGETFSLGQMISAQVAQFNRATGEFNIYLDGKMLQPVGGGGFSFDPLILGQLERAFGNGLNTVSVSATDGSGNTTSQSWSFTVVTDPPATPVLDDLADSLLATRSVTVTGSVADVKPDNPVSVALYVNSVSVKTVKVGDDGRFTVEDAPLVAGSNTINAIAVDAAGNQSDRSESLTVYVDEVAPTVTLDDLAEFTNQAALTVTGSATDDSDRPLKSIALFINGQEKATGTDADFSFDVTLESGENIIMVQAIDAAGNKGQSEEMKVTLDTEAPTTAASDLMAKSNLAGNAALLTWTADANAAAYNIYRSDAEIKDATGLEAVATGVTGTSFEDIGIATGTTYFYAVTSVDAAGNENPAVTSNSPNVALITSSGGTASRDGVSVTFGPNSIFVSQTRVAAVIIDKLSDDEVPALDNSIEGTATKLTVLGQAGASVDVFNGTAILAIPYSTGDSPKLFALDGEDWSEIESEVDKTRKIVTAVIDRPGIFRLATGAPEFPWDVNADGTVNIFDLVLVGKDFGKSGEGLAGDVNADGTVNIFDLVLVGKYFGQMVKDIITAPAMVDGSIDLIPVIRELDDGTFELTIETGEPIYGVQMDINFAADQKIRSVERGAAFENGFWLPEEVTGNKVSIVATLLSDAQGSAEIARIRFQATDSESVDQVVMSDIILVTPDGKPIAARILPIRVERAVTYRNALYQNYPNPFNPETWIPFEIAEEAHVSIRIFDLSGKLIREIDLGDLQKGQYVGKDKAAYWDGRNLNGERIASGIYYYMIEAGKFREMRKMVILK